MGRGSGVRAYWALVGAQWAPNNTNIPNNVTFFKKNCPMVRLDPASRAFGPVIVSQPQIIKTADLAIFS